MKNVYKISVVFLLMILGFSCSDDDKSTVNNGTPAILDLPEEGNTFLLEGDKAKETIATLNWQKSDYGTPTQITYIVEAAVSGTDFKEPVNAGTSSENTIVLTVAELNSAAITAGLGALEEGKLDIRIKSTLGTNKEMILYSNVITINVTPYPTIIAKKNLFLVGDATAAGWSENNNNTPLFRDPNNSNLFYYRGYFGAGSIKLLENKGSWHPQYGSNGGTTLNVSGLDGSNEPNPIAVATAGYYDLVVDIQKMTYSLTPYTGSTTTTYTTIGIVGDPTPGGWNTDTNMTVSSFDPHIWYITTVTLTNSAPEGGLKFRVDGDWAINWGGSTPISGLATLGGPNIPVTASKYDIWFNDLDGRYIFILIQ